MCWSEKCDSKVLHKFYVRTCVGNVGEVVEHEEKSCDEVETVREVTYLDDRVCAGGECEAAVTARTRSWSVMFRESGELLYGRRVLLKLIGTVYMSCVRPAILYEGVA